MPKNHRLMFTATDTAAVCATQSTTGAGPLLINGTLSDKRPQWIGTARFDYFMRPVTITAAGNMSAVTFTINGQDANLNTVTETIAGPNAGTVTSVNIYNRINSIVASAAVTNVSVGDGSTGTSRTIPMDVRVANFKASLAAMVTGTINYTIQYTFDNILDPTYANSAVYFNTDLATLVAATTNQFGYIISPVAGIRILINSSAAGSANFDIIEEGLNS